MIFWKNKKTLLQPPLKGNWEHHKFIIEKDGVVDEVSSQDLEARCDISYNPQLDFPKRTDLLYVMNKIAKFHEKGYLDAQPLWLGTYFQKEIDSLVLPPVRIKWINDKIQWGVFAEKDLKPMQYIGEYAGQVRRYKRADSKNCYCFQYQFISDEKAIYTIDAMNQGGITRFINHSQQANLKSALATLRNLSHVVLFTSRFVRAGEQICFDYGPSYWAKRSKPTEFSLYTQTI